LGRAEVLRCGKALFDKAEVTMSNHIKIVPTSGEGQVDTGRKAVLRDIGWNISVLDILESGNNRACSVADLQGTGTAGKFSVSVGTGKVNRHVGIDVVGGFHLNPKNLLIRCVLYRSYRRADRYLGVFVIGKVS